MVPENVYANISDKQRTTTAQIPVLEIITYHEIDIVISNDSVKELEI